MEGEDLSAVFEQLGSNEIEFAKVELDALRRKEYALKPLYQSRQSSLQRIPNFWSDVFLNGPEEVQQLFSPGDYAVLSSLKSLFVDRFDIQSETEGEPRSLRFTFEFDENDHFEDKTLVKEFRFVSSNETEAASTGSFVSKPVAIKWKNKKKDLTNGVLNAAIELYSAEEALKLTKGDQELEIVDRESLWQYEKLREKLEKEEEDSEIEPSFVNWFGYRGAVGRKQEKTPVANGGSNGVNGNATEEEDDEDLEDEDDLLLDVEIFPAGEEIAICLAEDLWPDVMDYFMKAQEEPEADFEGLDEDDFDEVEVSDDDAPELVAAEEVVVEKDDRPRKRQRNA